MKSLISIVVPVYNEELVIAELCRRLKLITLKLTKYQFEFILVENGSFDNSFKLLSKEQKLDKRIKILQIVKNVGTDGALIAGLTFAKGDAAIVMMADLQDIPELIPTFLQKWEDGYEIVYGVVKKRKKLRFTRRLGTFLFYKFIKIITDNLVIENASDFRLIDKKVYKTLIALPEHNKFFRGLVSWTGFKQIGIPFDRPERFAGESKAYFSTVVKVALNGIFSFSPLPFYIPITFSVISFIFSAIFLLFLQFSISIICFLFACLFFVLWIILEYVRRIFNEVQNRPQFIIGEKVGL